MLQDINQTVIHKDRGTKLSMHLKGGDAINLSPLVHDGKATNSSSPGPLNCIIYADV